MSSCDRRIAIGLKYCGGCKPNYDRLALVDQIRQRIAPNAVLVCHDHPGAVMILAVQGCPTACADLTPFEHLPVFIVRRMEEAEAFIEYLQSRLSEQLNRQTAKCAIDPGKRRNADRTENATEW